MPEEFSIANKTRTPLPRLPFLDIKNEILGKKYKLSIAFVGKKVSRELNKKYRGKDRPTNILSFSLHKNSGEIILCPEVVRKEAASFNKTFPEFLGFLVIHGMLHLDGMQHGSRMERAESKYDQKYFYRNRCRIVHNESRGRRIHQRRKKS